MSIVWGVVYAAGYGRRFGGYKQFETIRGERLVDRCVRVLAPFCEQVVVVVPPGHSWIGTPATHAVEGGATNPESVRNGIAAVPLVADTLLLHSPSHPLVTPALVEAVLAAVGGGWDGAAPALEVHDVLKRVDAQRGVTGSIDKQGVLITQMPMAFRAKTLRAALASSTDATDVQTLVEHAGGRVKLVPGDPANIHVTTRAELDLARRLA